MGEKKCRNVDGTRVTGISCLTIDRFGWRNSFLPTNNCGGTAQWCSTISYRKRNIIFSQMPSDIQSNDLGFPVGLRDCDCSGSLISKALLTMDFRFILF